MTGCVATERQFTGHGRRVVMLLVIGALTLAAGPVSATSIVPVSARELLARADVIVYGVVVANHMGEDALGRPETITIITPLEVLKGRVSGALVLHQLGGQLPDGRFFKLWGRPEYEVGHEVVVFAIARPEGGLSDGGAGAGQVRGAARRARSELRRTGSRRRRAGPGDGDAATPSRRAGQPGGSACAMTLWRRGNWTGFCGRCGGRARHPGIGRRREGP